MCTADASRSFCVAVSLFILPILSGCATHNSHPFPRASEAAFLSSDHLDLQPGWRLEVVTPVLKSGGFLLRTAPMRAIGDNMELTAGPDFIGYETSYYDVRLSNSSVLSIEFRSARTTASGKTTRKPQPLVQLFHNPPDTRYIRLMYLVRASQADHDMAVICAKSSEDLEYETEQVRKDPAAGCTGRSCYWIPKGIAVRRDLSEK